MEELLILVGFFYILERKAIYSIVYYILMVLILAYEIQLVSYISFVIIIIYLSAMTILFAFVIMLIPSSSSELDPSLSPRSLLHNYSLGALLFFLFFFLFFSGFSGFSESSSFLPFPDIQLYLFSSFKDNSFLALLGQVLYSHVFTFEKLIFITFILFVVLIGVIFLLQ